jgi:hypothetical protein
MLGHIELRRFRDLCILNSKNDVTGLETRHVGNATIYHRSNNNFAGILRAQLEPNIFQRSEAGTRSLSGNDCWLRSPPK